MQNIKAGENEFNKVEVKQINSQPTEVENNSLGDSDFGKFSTATELKNAYNSLQAEFTKRCQRRKEWEGEVKNASLKREITREEKLDIIKEYLEDIKQNNPAFTLTFITDSVYSKVFE